MNDVHNPLPRFVGPDEPVPLTFWQVVAAMVVAAAFFGGIFTACVVVAGRAGLLD